MAIGMSLDLDQMLRLSLTTLLRKLSCSAGAVYAVGWSEGRECTPEPIYSIPRMIEHHELFAEVLSKFPEFLERKRSTTGGELARISGSLGDNGHYHMVDLPGFGVLLLLKSGEDISPLVLKALQPLSVKLANACRACLQQRSLKESESKFRSIFDTANDAIWIHDSETGQVLDVNQRMCEMHKCTKEEALSRNVEDLSSGQPPFTQREALNWIKKAAEEGPQLFEWLCKDIDGGLFWVETNLKQTNIAGEERVLAIVRDITERKRMEEELQLINTELEGFAHTVSHDLKGPLTAAALAGYTLKELIGAPGTEEARPEVLEMYDILSRNVEKANDLIDDILELAEAGETPGGIDAVDVGQVVEGILEERAEIIAEKGIGVRVSEDLGRARANPTHVYQVFSNLIGNAIKHNDSESPRITIARLQDDDRGGHRYLVRDNGSGIPPEDLDKLFIPFFKRKPWDTGIGLSIVEKILKVYDGEITAYNDNGACFEFRLRDFCQE